MKLAIIGGGGFRVPLVYGALLRRRPFDEIVLHAMTCRERWGISYFVVRELDEFAPVMQAFGR